VAHNPTRTKNFYKNTDRRRGRVRQKGAGTKHSDILRRQGVGMTMAIDKGQKTASGFSTVIFEGKDFIVRGEVLAENNLTPFGVNAKADRIYYVTHGILFANVQDGDKIKTMQFQAGDTFKAVRKTHYSVASANTAVEMIITESTDYEKNFKKSQDGHFNASSNFIASANETNRNVAKPAPRRPRRNQAKAKAVQAEVARRKFGGGPRAGTPSAAAAAPNGGANANSANSVGANPRPMGPGAFRDE